jgi:hypothetical protein
LGGSSVVSVMFVHSGLRFCRGDLLFRCGLASLSLVATLACGPKYPSAEYPPTPPPRVDAAGHLDVPAPPGSLWRHDVNATVDQGLGRFLQRVDVEPELSEGKFVGFRITDLHPLAWWQGVDLAPGDVVLSVNGKPIERATEAHAVFDSLKTATELRVTLLRAGKTRELTYKIVEQTAAAAQPAAVAPAAPPPAAATPEQKNPY